MIIAKRPVSIYDFKAFGAAIKAARNEYGESRKKVSDEFISPRAILRISITKDSSRAYKFSMTSLPVMLIFGCVLTICIIVMAIPNAC